MIDSKHLVQFLPKEFEYLTKTDKIVCNDTKLKTCYIINLMNELIVKYYFTNEIYFNLYSLILRRKYTHLYHKYLDYVVSTKFLSLVSKHYTGKKACTYKLNIDFLDNVIRVKVYDTILLKKYKKEYIEESITEYVKSPIPVEIRKKLVKDLYSVKLDYKKALDYLISIRKSGEIDEIKFNKNYCSIENISSDNIFFKFDSFGRIHTNFTVLKKEIRNNFLSIDGEELCEVDIKNSQPFFLSLLMKDEMMLEKLESKEIKRYFDLVKLGLVYDDLQQRYSELIDRDDAKQLIYRVFFGPNRENKKECKMFRKVYPEIYDFICEYKSMNKNYRCISHMLQFMESRFIFKGVIRELMNKHPEIKIITVHDSLLYQCRYKEIVEGIFYKQLNKLYI